MINGRFGPSSHSINGNTSSAKIFRQMPTEKATAASDDDRSLDRHRVNVPGTTTQTSHLAPIDDKNRLGPGKSRRKSSFKPRLWLSGVFHGSDRWQYPMSQPEYIVTALPRLSRCVGQIAVFPIILRRSSRPQEGVEGLSRNWSNVALCQKGSSDSYPRHRVLECQRIDKGQNE